MELSRPKPGCLSDTPLNHSISHSEHRTEQALVNPRHDTSCPSLVKYPIEEEIPPFSFRNALFAIFQYVSRAVTMLSSLPYEAKKLIYPTSALTTPLLRAARYSSNLDNEIDHNDYVLITRTGISLIGKGVLRPSGTRVAIKTMIRFGADSDVAKRTLREIHIWSKLRHDNVLPLLGITTIPHGMVSVVTEWMSRGNAHDYVQDASVDPRPLIVGIACGLFYLHNHTSGPIIHGDLKGMNVLISAEGRALLTDFGHSHLINSSFSMTIDPPRGGTLNWLAPENVDSEECAVTLPGDIWAFGMTALELFSRKIPFHDARNLRSVLLHIFHGPPGRPDDECTCFRMSDGWWNLCNLCWKYDPLLRPDISVLTRIIEQLD